MKRVVAIVAMDEGRVIGRGNRLPWNLPEDLAHFKQCTMGQAVLMGRKTWESLPARARPLPGRTNVVLTSRSDSVQAGPEVQIWPSFEEKLSSFDGTLWIAGGAEVYRSTMPYWDEVMLSLVPGQHEGDVFFPEFEKDFDLQTEEAKNGFTVRHYLRRV